MLVQQTRKMAAYMNYTTRIALIIWLGKILSLTDEGGGLEGEIPFSHMQMSLPHRLRSDKLGGIFSSKPQLRLPQIKET